MNKIVGVQGVKVDVISKEYLDERKRVAREEINKITKKPELNDLLKTVDDIWNKPHRPQLVFENKDQHYAYITTLYRDVLEPMSLDEYKSYLIQSVEQRLDGAVGLIERTKIQQAAKLNAEYVKKHTEDKLNEGLADLQERNNKITEAIKKEIQDDVNSNTVK